MTNRRKLIMPTEAEDAAINAGIASDPDTRELTREDFKNMKSVDQLPAAAQAAIAGVRGKQKKPRKESTTIRLDAEVTKFYGKGKRGWQTRINHDLVAVSHIQPGEIAVVSRDPVTGQFIILGNKPVDYEPINDDVELKVRA